MTFQDNPCGICGALERDDRLVGAKHAQLRPERPSTGDSFGKPPSGTNPPGVTRSGRNAYAYHRRAYHRSYRHWHSRYWYE